MSATSHLIRRALTLTLASVSLMALGVTAVFAKDPDQALEDLLGIAPETQTRTPERSLTITRPDAPGPVQPTVSQSAVLAPVPAVAPPAAPPVSPLAAAPKADGGRIPGKRLATLPATPAALPEKFAPAQDAGTPTAPNDPRLPSAVLEAQTGTPSTAPQNIALSSPIGVPRPLPELAPPAADAPTETKGTPSALATLRMIPRQQPARTPEEVPVSPTAKPDAADNIPIAPTPAQSAHVSPIPALPSAKAPGLDLITPETDGAPSMLLATTGDEGLYDISVADPLGKTAASSTTVTRPPVNPIQLAEPGTPVTAYPLTPPVITGVKPTLSSLPIPLPLPSAAAPLPLAVDDLVDRLIFTAFSSSLPQELREGISRKILTELRQRPLLRVQISGFADWTPNGSVEASTAISQRRAENVARFLREQGIAASRMQVKGVGVDFLPGAPRDRVDVTVVAP